jgi:hypothetical protein
MKDDVVLEERLRAAADHFERMAAQSEPEMTMRGVAPELAALLREAADAYKSAREYRDSWANIRGTEPRNRSSLQTGPASYHRFEG